MCALRANAPQIGRGIFDAAHLHPFFNRAFKVETASHPTIRADRLPTDGLGFRESWQWVKAHHGRTTSRLRRTLKNGSKRLSGEMACRYCWDRLGLVSNSNTLVICRRPFGRCG